MLSTELTPFQHVNHWSLGVTRNEAAEVAKQVAMRPKDAHIFGQKFW